MAVLSNSDYALVGGGLHNCLLALALRARQPDVSITLVEAQPRLGGNHTWCFHHGDIPEPARPWLEPLQVRRWDGYEVRFPGLRRSIDRPYTAITGERLHEVVSSMLTSGPGQLLLGREATEVSAHRVRLRDGDEFAATVVVDARGPRANDQPSGFQKFLGQELRLDAPHGLDRPVLMDATVDQREGYRFMYLLPFGPDRVLAEDTYFNQESVLDRDRLRARIMDYATLRGWSVRGVVREEEGVLPMPWTGEIPSPAAGLLRAGYDGGFFHPATGYSLPIAVRLAEAIAGRSPEELLPGGLDAFLQDHRRQVSTCHLLNSMLFRWFPPEQRWHVFERFYRLPLDTIERFYALRLTHTDRRRLLVGRPPRGMSLRYRFARGGRG